MTITFIGHSRIQATDCLKRQIASAIEENMQKENTTFLCGGYGDFDMLCAQTVKELKTVYANVSSVYVTPYVGDTRLKKMHSENLYDSILYPGLEHIPYRFAIVKRNEYMIDAADLVIAYVNKLYGGAYKSLLYATRKNKRILNLGI